MEVHSQQAGSTRQEKNPRRLLSVCECYLRQGDYITCRDFAIKAQICYPNHPGPAQILTICSILAASSSTARPDWYSILHLPRFAEDLSALEKNFNILSNLLNPTENPFSMAAKAHQWVIKAWTVLSEPSLKALVDRELRMEEKSGRNGPTFWTKRPKCCYMYEYEKKYNGCLLRCQNVKCRGAFKVEPLPASAAPPPEVVSCEAYVCYGFSPLERGRKWEAGREGWKCWWPFMSRVTASVKSKANIKGDKGSRNEKGDEFVDISDEEKEDGNGLKSDVKDGAYSGVVNRDEAKAEQVEKQNNGGKMVMKRTKRMARTSKKVMGRGMRISLNEIFPEEADDEGDMEVEDGGDSRDLGCGDNRNGEKGVSDFGVLKFMEVTDDIYVSLESDFVVGNEKIGPL